MFQCLLATQTLSYFDDQEFLYFLNKYCANPIHRTKSECTFNSHPKCETSPWLSSCGGTGNKCEYTPNAVECKEPCLSSPWLLECGGDGDKCKHIFHKCCMEKCQNKCPLCNSKQRFYQI